jgi:hypothetical protein
VFQPEPPVPEGATSYEGDVGYFCFRITPIDGTPPPPMSDT